MKERGDIIEEANQVVEKHASWRTKYALKQVEAEKKREEGRCVAMSKIVVDDANYWLDDVELRQGREIGEVVRYCYKREGEDIYTEELPRKIPVKTEKNPFDGYRPGR